MLVWFGVCTFPLISLGEVNGEMDIGIESVARVRWAGTSMSCADSFLRRIGTLKGV